MDAQQKKEIKRAYAEAGTTPGVFVIRNVAASRVLLGTSTNVNSIMNRHRFQLDLNGHPNSGLQRDWNASGKDSFTFEVLDTLKKEDLVDRDVNTELAALKELWREKLAGPPSNVSFY